MTKKIIKEGTWYKLSTCANRHYRAVINLLLLSKFSVSYQLSVFLTI